MLTNKRQSVSSSLRVLSALCVSSSSLFFALRSAPAASEAHASQDAMSSSFRGQSQEEADRKSAGCISCHSSTDEPTMHPTKTVHLGCTDCHGPFADGNRDDDDYPMGANLRTTRLDAAGIKLTISCGRPGTGMPSFDGGAYTVRACYGRPLGAAPDNLQPTPRTLSLDEIDALVAYLAARIVGHGKVTREECLFYYEGKADCDDFK